MTTSLRARGDHHEHSDVDLLVVMDEIDDEPRRRSEIEQALACYHAQQATEKTLKAALVAARIDPPRTHDLNQLRDLLPEEWRLPGSSDDLQLLTGWAAKSRYPNGLDEFTDDLAARGIDTAQAIYDAVTDELSRRGMAVE